MDSSANIQKSTGWKQAKRQAVAAVAYVDERFLIIRRSKHVRSPLYFCFPGGGVEPGELVEQAIVREMQEELGVVVVPKREIWRSKTLSGFQLHWWHVDVKEPCVFVPDPMEVEMADWMTLDQIMQLDPLLPTNVDFFREFQSGRISF
ncbi:MAG: NUDIX hydrolase [Pirellulaceae bacterium]